MANASVVGTAGIALYLDWDNLALSEQEGVGVSKWLGNLMQKLSVKGNVLKRVAYADWTHYTHHTRLLDSHGVSMIEICTRGRGSKNFADIYMAVDAMEDVSCAS